MKKLTAIIFLLLSINCYSQITTMTVEEEPEEKVQRYDSLENFNCENAKLHIGQTLFIKGSGGSKKDGFSYMFYTKPYFSLDNEVYKPIYKGADISSYTEIAGKYYKVTNVFSEKSILSKNIYYLELVGSDSIPFYLKEENYHNAGDIITLGYYEKMKQLFIGKEFYAKFTYYYPKPDRKEPITLPPRTKFKCTDIVVYPGEYGCVYAILENSKFGKMKKEIEKGPIIDNYVSIAQYNKYIRKYGATFGDKVALGKLKIGMNKDMVRDTWGSPDHINTTRGKYGTHEQWVYNSSYLYFENGKLTSIQN